MKDKKGKEANYAVIGAGLAGTELAYQLARSGVKVLLFEMRPVVKTAVHESELFAELVCSNSFRGADPHNAVGLLKEEMAGLGSLVMEVAKETEVPAGGALAVDRQMFSKTITERLTAHPTIEVIREEVRGFEACEGGVAVVTEGNKYPVRRAICATGPLTSAPLFQFLEELVSKKSLYFYDSIAPIVAAESIDRSIVFEASRYGKGEGADYLNCPMNEAEYGAFHAALLAAEKIPLHEVDKPIFFEGCLPIEVMAERGRETLSFGPMKPVGLLDPRTGERPYAVVQLRLENREGTAYNLVGFQTRLKQGEQRQVFAMIPGLEQAEFLRYGAMHRNAYLESPRVLNDFLESPKLLSLHFAGQMTGVEGYVESAAIGLLLGKLLPRLDRGLAWLPPPKTTALGALYAHLREEPISHFSPNNVHFGLFKALDGRVRKNERKEAMVSRAREEFGKWMEEIK